MKKLNNFIKSRAFIITLSLTFIALIIAGVTYAWFTWTSTDNTNITMQIGEYTTVTYTGGNAINITDLAPVYNYTDGESTTFTLTNNNTDVTKEFKYSVYLDITSISNELKTTQFKYVLLDGSSNIIDQGDFSTASNNSTLTITENKSLPNGNSSYTFLLYIDGNETNNSNMMNKTLTGSLRVVVNRSDVDLNVLHVTTATDYEYTILNKEETGYNVDYILLTKYIGIYPNIQVPNTMIISNKEYKTVLFTGVPPTGAFYGNKTIESVMLPSDYLATNCMYNDQYCTFNPNSALMESLFRECTSLTTVTDVPSSIINISGAFYGCTNLTGTIRINSDVVSSLSSAIYPFGNTVLPIIVEVPENSQTYNNLNISSKPANVTVTTFTP